MYLFALHQRKLRRLLQRAQQVQRERKAKEGLPDLQGQPAQQGKALRALQARRGMPVLQGRLAPQEIQVQQVQQALIRRLLARQAQPVQPVLLDQQETQVLPVLPARQALLAQQVHKGFKA